MKNHNSYTHKELQDSTYDQFYLAVSSARNITVKCLGCDKDFVYAEDWELPFEGIFYGNGALPVCKECASKF